MAIPGDEESWRSILRNTHPNRTTFALHSEVERLRTPTLLIWGEKDRIDPPVPDAIAIAEHLPNARLVLLPNAGHAPWFDEPDQCSTLVTEFLKDGMTAAALSAEQTAVMAAAKRLTSAFVTASDWRFGPPHIARLEKPGRPAHLDHAAVTDGEIQTAALGGI